DHNDSEEKEHLVYKLIQKFNHKIAKCQKCIEKANQQARDLENQNKDLQDKYDVLINHVNTFEEKNNEFNEQIKVLNKKNADLLDQTKVLKDQLQVKHVVIDTHVECHEKYAKLEEEIYEYMIRYSALFDNDKQHRKHIADQEVLFDKISVELVELDKHVRDLKNTVIEKDFKISELEKCVCNKDLEIEKCLERLNVCENKIHKMGQTNQTVHMIMPSKDNLYSGRKGIENQSENDCHVVEKEYDKVENSKVIAHGLFKLSVSQSVSPISMSKTSCDSKNVENKLKRKRRKRQSSKQNDKQVNNDVSHANSNFVHFSASDTFSSVRRPKHSGVIWKKKESSNTFNVDLSSVSLSKLNKNVKRYSRKDLLSCNNSHLGETSSAYVCNDAMNVFCQSRMCDLFDDNNFFIFDDESVRISPVSKIPFRKKPRDSMNVHSKSNSNKSLSRTVHKWLLNCNR
nr:hypothetical protein [Tanacetum cinerariifolium]